MSSTTVRTSFTAIALLCLSIAAGRCSPAPPKVDVVAELNKLNISSLPKTYTPEQVADIERVWDGPGKWFVQTGCFGCHPVSVYEIKSLAPIAPDLSLAVEDVRSRFGRSLEDFFTEPQGTMQMVFTQLIKLDEAQKATAIAELHKAHDLYKSKTPAGAAHD